MPGRPLETDDLTDGSGGSTHRGGRVPFGVLLLMGAVTAVFVYGIYLKTSGAGDGTASLMRSSQGSSSSPAGHDPSSHPSDDASARAGEEAVSRIYGREEPLPLEGPDASQKPLIPESPPATSRPPGSVPSPPPASLPPSPPDETAAKASDDAARTKVVPPKADERVQAASSSGTIARAAPRGPAPAATLRKAREQFAAKNYTGAARSWNEWAQKVPDGSWTVQIAAVRLDRAGPLGTLGAGREELFVLPPGRLPNGLSPVCLGIYPSAEAARKALTSVSALPGSSGRPMVKPLRSLRTDNQAL